MKCDSLTTLMMVTAGKLTAQIRTCAINAYCFYMWSMGSNFDWLFIASVL